MSHYTVAVITKTNPYETNELRELLAPFDENLEVEKYVYRTREQIIKDAKEHKEALVKKIEEETDIEKLKNYLISPTRQYSRKLLTAVTDSDFYWAEVDRDMFDVIDGNEYSTYNPDSKWDWYEVGGRWSGLLISKADGKEYNSLQIKDWDYDVFNTDELHYYCRFWDVVVDGAEPTKEEKEEHIFGLYNREYYLKKYGSKSNFIKCMCTFSTYALLTPDGEWFAPGKMGWFGCSHAEPEDEFKWERDYIDLIKTFDPEYYVTIVDCHI